jgi:hypothetical protein
MVQVLRATGKLAHEIEGKMLVLMLDEATKLTNVTNPDSTAHWVNAFKILSDSTTKEVGIVVSISLRQIDEFPDPLRDQQVQTRFGTEHYIDLPNFHEEEAREFMEALLSEWIDAGRRLQIIAAYADESEGEGITDTFPFTDPAFDRFIQYACRSVVTTPRDLQKSLDDFLNKAMDADRHVLSFEFVESIVSGD